MRLDKTTTGSSYPSEMEIQDKFFNVFLDWHYPNSVRVKNWRGWSLRTDRNHSHKSPFYREFDLAVFYKDATEQLLCEGFEVKGYTNTKDGKPVEPEWGEGLDQALALLFQSADYAYLIYPEPQRIEDKKDLKTLCDNFAPCVGLIYVPNDLASYSLYRTPQRNYHTTVDIKKKKLASLIASGNLSDIKVPLWAAQHNF